MIQLPVMWALYQAIWRTPEMQNGKFLWMDLGKPDPYYILPILATVFTFLSSYIAPLSVPKSSQTTMTKMMSYVMAIMVGIWAIVFQSAISLCDLQPLPGWPDPGPAEPIQYRRAGS